MLSSHKLAGIKLLLVSKLHASPELSQWALPCQPRALPTSSTMLVLYQWALLMGSIMPALCSTNELYHIGPVLYQWALLMGSTISVLCSTNELHHVSPALCQWAIQVMGFILSIATFSLHMVWVFTGIFPSFETIILGSQTASSKDLIPSVLRGRYDSVFWQLFCQWEDNYNHQSLFPGNNGPGLDHQVLSEKQINTWTTWTSG